MERRREHWGRAVRLITESERRVARHDALRRELDRSERRLRKLVQEKLAPRATWDEARRLVGELVVAPQGELPASLRRGWRGLVLRWGRRGGLPVEVRRALEVDRELRRRLARSAPAARAAGRRLDRLRRRARAINPWRVREEARGELKDAAWRVRQVIGVRSLVAQAAPGIGTALGLVRIARRVVRSPTSTTFVHRRQLEVCRPPLGRAAAVAGAAVGNPKGFPRAVGRCRAGGGGGSFP